MASWPARRQVTGPKRAHSLIVPLYRRLVRNAFHDHMPSSRLMDNQTPVMDAPFTVREIVGKQISSLDPAVHTGLLQMSSEACSSKRLPRPLLLDLTALLRPYRSKMRTKAQG